MNATYTTTFTKIASRWIIVVFCVLAIFSPVFSLPVAHAEGEGAPEVIGPGGYAATQGIGPNKAELKLNLAAWQKALYNLFTGFGGIFLWLGGFMLDYSIKLLVVDMGGSIESFGIGPAIDGIWAIIRDVFNLFFIFGLIFIGFKTILGIDDNAAKKTLGSLLIAALLINFSLYATKVVIDFSNIAAYEIYQLIQIDGSYSSAIFGDVEGIAGKFMSMTDLQSYTDTQADTLNNMIDSTGGDFKIIGFALIVMVFMLITAFVFLAGAFILISRFILLILLMMFSPVLFLGSIFPGFKKLSDEWKSKLLSNAFVAPAYLFMIYLSLFALEGMQFTESSFSQAFDGNAGESGLIAFFLYYLIIIGFVYASLVVAQKMGAAGADRTLSMGNSMGKSIRGRVQTAAGGSTFGLLGAGGRVLFGEHAQSVAEDEGLKDRASSSGMRGFAARRRLSLARKIGDASFDARNVAGVGKKLGIGEGAKGGYKTQRDAVVKTEKEYAKSLGEVDDDDTQVQILNKNVTETQKEIGDIKYQKATISDPVLKADFQEEIDKLEKTLITQKEAVKAEKSRRQIGTGNLTRGFQAAKTKFDNSKEELKELKTAFKASATEEETKKIAEAIRNKKSEIKEHKSSMNKHTDGYASVVENSGFVAKLLQGRYDGQNLEAGKSIRDEFEKKVKKTKDDERFEALGETIEKSSKKD